MILYLLIHIACAVAAYLMNRAYTRRYAKWTKSDRAWMIGLGALLGPILLAVTVFVDCIEDNEEEASW